MVQGVGFEPHSDFLSRKKLWAKKGFQLVGFGYPFIGHCYGPTIILLKRLTIGVILAIKS
jgi:hypothetical protein